MELLQNKRRIPLNGLQIFWLPSPLIARYSQWTLNDGLKWERHVIGGHWTELDWTGVNAIPPIYTYYRDLTAAPTALLDGRMTGLLVGRWWQWNDRIMKSIRMQASGGAMNPRISALLLLNGFYAFTAAAGAIHVAGAFEKVRELQKMHVIRSNK